MRPAGPVTASKPFTTAQPHNRTSHNRTTAQAAGGGGRGGGWETAAGGGRGRRWRAGGGGRRERLPACRTPLARRTGTAGGESGCGPGTGGPAE
eukprot:4170538-Prymnesium_polylepis.1